MNRRINRYAIPLTVAATAALAAGTAAGANFTGWGPAVPETAINDPVAADGCPIESPDGLRLYIASNRLGTLGANDIWVSTRASKVAAWSAPQNVGVPINSTAADFCPTPLHGEWLMFVSERPGPDTCGAGPGKGDMYLARLNPRHGWSEPLNLGCAETGDGPNTAGSEFSPSLVETDDGTLLFFSSNGYNGNMDIFVSRVRADGSFAPATRVDELSTGSDDRMPNVSKDGLEVVFSSSRPGGFGSQDVYTASRSGTDQPWSAPVNVGANVNTAGSETRASLSGDSTRLHFGRDGEIYVSSRARITGKP